MRTWRFAALYCHDTVEDTNTTIEEIADIFSDKVASGVAALSKDKSLHGEAATRDSLTRIKKQPHEVWAVKLADRAANLQAPPDHWNQAKRLAYAREGLLILEALGTASPYLANVLSGRIQAWKIQSNG
ncbi:MAG: HD domain-containing protein [Candidatus Adiutrix sp.]|jgi:(p)ppGpp synthase/HD superfamily hydrolase|nr:HD domain-containing protein [Candidatus Adiutrix sp.]